MTDERNKTIAFEGGHEVAHGLHRAWRREISFHLVRGLCYLLAFASGLVLLGLCVDWLLWMAGSPPYAPAALLVVGAGVLVWVAYRCWRQLRSFDALREALRVEQANPDINSLLVSSVQLREDESDASGVSADLIRIVRREAAARSATIHFERIVSFRSLRGILIVAIVVMAVVASVGVFRSGFLWTFARRMFNPLVDIAYPTSTRIDVLSGNLTVRKASPVTLRARAEGQVPEKGLLYVRIGSAGWERIDLSRQDGDEFRFAFEQAHQNIDYYFRVGDAKSGTYRVTVEAPPRIVEAHVDLRYPQYTKMPPQELSTLNLKLPEGTEVRWRLRTDRPILRAEMIREDSEPQSMQINEGGLALEAAAPANASLSYRFRLHWEIDGREQVVESVKHFVRVIPDVEPVVALIHPVEDQKATLGKTLTVSFRARDDYGLSESWIVYSVNDGAEQKHPIGSLDEEPAIERKVRWSIKASLADLAEGDIVTYAIEVSDGRTSPEGAHLGRSASRRVQFVSEKNYLAHVLARRQKYLGQIRPLYLQEKDAAYRIRTLEKFEPMGTAGSTEDKEAVR